MTSSIRLNFSVRALRHIEEILQYALDTRGTEQRDDYGDVLGAAFERIRQFPDFGHPVVGQRSNIREYHLEHHSVYYKRDPKRSSSSES